MILRHFIRRDNRLIESSEGDESNYGITALRYLEVVPPLLDSYPFGVHPEISHMTVLVTGATGLVGNNVVRQLLAQGQPVRVLVRQSSDPRPLDGLDVDVRNGDIRDADAVQTAIRGCRAVVHAAALVQIGWTGMDEARMINVEGTRHVAQAAIAAEARMVHVSSVDALGTGSAAAPIHEDSPLTPRVPCPYPVTKREAELTVLDMTREGLDGVVVNPSFLLGPWDWKPSSGRMLLTIAKLRPWFAPRADNDFTSVTDVADAIVTAIERGRTGERYILSGEHHDYLSAWRTIAAACGISRPCGILRPFFSVGRIPLTIGGWVGDLKTRLTGREGDVNTAAVRLMRQPHYYSHEKATNQLDYHPRNLRAAAADAWTWFQEYGYS